MPDTASSLKMSSTVSWCCRQYSAHFFTCTAVVSEFWLSVLYRVRMNAVGIEIPSFGRVTEVHDNYVANNTGAL